MSNKMGWKMAELPGLNDCSTKSSRKTVTNGLPQGFILISISLNNFIKLTWMVEQNTSSAGLQMMQNWDDWNTRWVCCSSKRPWKTSKWAHRNILESVNQLCRKRAEDTIAQRSPVVSWIKLGRALLSAPNRKIYSPLLRMGETMSGGLYSGLGSIV